MYVVGNCTYQKLWLFWSLRTGLSLQRGNQINRLSFTFHLNLIPPITPMYTNRSTRTQSSVRITWLLNAHAAHQLRRLRTAGPKCPAQIMGCENLISQIRKLRKTTKKSIRINRNSRANGQKLEFLKRLMCSDIRDSREKSVACSMLRTQHPHTTTTVHTLCSPHPYLQHALLALPHHFQLFLGD